VPVAQASDPSYSGGRDQENHGLKPAWANSSVRPYLKNTFIKRAGGVAQGVGSEFKPQYPKKNKKQKTKQKKLYTVLLVHLHFDCNPSHEARCEIFHFWHQAALKIFWILENFRFSN
jgi:hypothetical protein